MKNIGTKIAIHLPNKPPYVAVFLGETTNNNLIKIKTMEGDFGFVNKKFVTQYVETTKGERQ